ncbi:hypothetical protein [Roseovarius faecimaris]|nr:hypothetical protein [Roseovarius faecimaris]
MRTSVIGNIALWREQRVISYLLASDRARARLAEEKLSSWAVNHPFDEV